MTNATDALRQMLRLFDEQGNVTADPAKLQAAINDGYLTLSALSQLTASPDREKVAAEIARGIIEDLSDRRGLRHAWEGIDDDIRAEIKAEWTTIAQSALQGAGQ